MATFKNRNGRITAIIRLKGAKPVSRTFSNEAHARSWADTVEKELLAEMNTAQRRSSVRTMTLGHLLMKVWSDFSQTHKGKRSEYRRIKQIQLCDIANIPVDEISPQAIRDFRNMRLETVAPATVIRELGMISSALKIAMSEYDIVLPYGNPASVVKRPKAPPGRDRRLVNGNKEVDAILKYSDSPHLADVVWFALETGMRRGEVTTLKKDAFDIKRRVVRLTDTKNSNPRTVPLSSKACQILLSRLSMKGDRFFPISPDTITQAFCRARKRAGVTGLRLHDLRHEATSRLFEDKGFNQIEVATVTGHKDMRMLKRYAHLEASRLVDRLG